MKNCAFYSLITFLFFLYKISEESSSERKLNPLIRLLLLTILAGYDILMTACSFTCAKSSQPFLQADLGACGA